MRRDERDTDWAAALDRFALPGLGRLRYDLGNVYQAVGKANANGSALFRLLVPSPADPHPERGLTAAGWTRPTRDSRELAGASRRRRRRTS